MMGRTCRDGDERQSEALEGVWAGGKALEDLVQETVTARIGHQANSESEAS